MRTLSICLLFALLFAGGTAFATGDGQCEDITEITGCPFVDSGDFDGDNDCSDPNTPLSDVFYEFTPAADGYYQFRLVTSAGSVALRVVSGECCGNDADTEGFSNSNLPSDCGEDANRRTYLSVYLNGNEQYWIHVGVTSGTSTASYELEVACVPCPDEESATNHGTCETAQEIACNDSLIGDDATSTHPDWYSFTLANPSHVTVWVGGREWGHCISGFRGADAKFRLYDDCEGDYLVEGTNEGCDDDAVEVLNCLPAGTYFIKVFNNNSDSYILKVSCEEPEACPNVLLENQHCAGACVGSLDNGGVTEFYIDVPIPYVITDLNVRVNVLHGRVGDLTVDLITPWLDEIELSSHNGGNGQNYTNTCFDDEAATSITAGAASFTGDFIPEEPLSSVDGYIALGTWTLRIDDPNTLVTWTNDTGSVYCWCLEFDYDQILAVELNSFTAVAGDGMVNLHWQTATESGNDHFEISRDGETVALIDSRGDSPTGHAYTWEDREVINGRAYEYALIAVDLNGIRETLATRSASPRSSAGAITEYALHQNYPNPFNPSTTIRYDLPESAPVELYVVDALGREVGTLVNGTMPAGAHTVEFNAADLPSGLYFYVLNSGSFHAAQKMLLIK